VVKNGIVNATPFLDLTGVIDNTSSEQGLLGLAFHPDYANNGYFYVNYTRDPGPGDDLTTVARYRVSAGNPDVADTAETKLLEIPQDAANHNGGDLHFGPDGFLYIAMGDGGGSNDFYGHAQDITSLKGKMLRIDVDGAPVEGDVLCGLIKNYGIPASNPFADSEGCDEIWSYGLRNPWRFSFDRNTGDMYIGDVGQNLWEEIDFEPAATGGRNYGWSCREGAHDFPSGNDCIGVTPTDPIIEYSHNPHCSVTGGYVYRGSNPLFDGYYFYGDYCSDVVWLAIEGDAGWSSTQWPLAAPTLDSISSFGEDEQGNLYIADRNAGKVYRIVMAWRIFADSFE
jgi:glucose/arabinose dehydrogenase